MNSPFHLAILITNIQKAREFYVNILDCKEGRFTDTWIDFDFYGNQLSMHLTQSVPKATNFGYVDGVAVPIPHYGVILTIDQFERISKKLVSSKTHFIIPPQVRYKNKGEEQRTMFLQDPFGNNIEIKGVFNLNDIF